MHKEWIIPDDLADDRIDALASELKIPKILAQILIKRDIQSTEEAKKFFSPNLKRLHDPFLMKNMDQFRAIADKFYVQIRGIHGEHTETNDGVFDISNKRRLGRSEKDLVQDMYNGVKAMIEAEKKLATPEKKA